MFLAKVGNEDFLVEFLEGGVVEDPVCGSLGYDELAPLFLCDENQDFAIHAGIGFPFFRDVRGVLGCLPFSDVVEQYGIYGNACLFGEIAREGVEEFCLLGRNQAVFVVDVAFIWARREPERDGG